MSYRETVQASRWLLIPGVAAGAGLLVWAVTEIVTSDASVGERFGSAAAAIVGAGVLLGVSLLLSRVQVQVTQTGVRIRLGPFGHAIKPGQLADVRSERYVWWRWGGWGLRIRPRGRAYTVPFRLTGVRFTARDGREYYVSSRDPERLEDAARALLRARGRDAA